MCLGTIALVTAMGPDRCVEVRGDGRDSTASLLAVSDPVEPGDWVLVHSGLVLARLSEQEARNALELRDPTREGAP
jgi:hydrogenase expression/formation protein HypC